jgi:MoaA/NifB/PqqE/SkfB family radical SAM enzyme
MRKVGLLESLQIIEQAALNWSTSRPLVVSFEVTDSCNCFCRHCDHGGMCDDSRNLTPADYRRYMDVLRPVLVQVSGGEPLLRPDLEELVANIKNSHTGLPYIILVSNWALMSEPRYLALRKAGVDQFSVSLDFPDRRHDVFRGFPGLFDHLDDIIPRCAQLGFDDIVLNTCIHAENVAEVNGCADQAQRWGVNICYSAYSARRTGNRDLFLNHADQLRVLDEQLDRIERRKNESNWIVSASTTLDATRSYFRQAGAPGCKAGQRFLVVTAQGMLQPCSMQFIRYDLAEQSRMVHEFTENNSCDQCYVAIRSNLDKTFPQLVRENVGAYLAWNGRGFSPNGRTQKAAAAGC